MKEFKKIFENLVVGIAVVIVLFLGATILLPKVGYGLVFITSGSMEPTIKTGGAVITQKNETYQKNDIITFVKESNNLVTHRVIETIKTDGKRSYKTKGDNNNAEDSGIVNNVNVLGKTIFTMPYVGWAIGFLKTRVGILILILIPTIYFIALEILKIKKELRKRKSTKCENLSEEERKEACEYVIKDDYVIKDKDKDKDKDKEDKKLDATNNDKK